MARRKTSSADRPRGDRWRTGAGCAGILAALCLLDVRVAQAAGDAVLPAWEGIAGLAVGAVVAGAAVALALQIRRLLRVLPAPPVEQPAAPEDPGASPDGRHLRDARFELFKRMRGDLDPPTLAAAVLDYLGGYHGAAVGVLYLARPDHSLEPVATSGLAPGAAPPRTVVPGEGIVGRAVERREVAVLEQVDERHLDLVTGLGQSPPRSVIVAPFHCAGQVKGALELGVAAAVADAELDLLRQSAESVAMALDSSLARVRARRLLKETRRQAQVLAAKRRELQHKNAELERADRYKNEFLANMSHELRTPLNSMLIISQILAENEGGNLTPEQVENALTINQAGNELLLIINDILDMSRVEAGCLDIHPEPTDLRHVLRGLEDLFRPTAERRGLSLRATWDADVPRTVVTDPLRLSQILKNLLDNAFKFTAAGGVELRLQRAAAAGLDPLPVVAGDGVAVTVRDTGIGMDAETVGRVFGAFQQGDGSIARRYGGSGLGLTISRRLAELLGGEIRVTSREGQGSDFVLLLPGGEGAPAVRPPSPDEPPAEAAHAPATPDDRDLAGRRVLLADTDMRTVFELSSALDAAGAEVEVARSPAGIRERLGAGGPWDLLVAAGELLEDPAGPGPEAGARGAGVIVLGAPRAGTADDLPFLTRPVDPAACLRLCRGLVAGEATPVHPEVGMQT